MTRDLTDALAKLGRDDHTFRAGLLHTRIDYFLTSPEWKINAGGVESSDASDHRPIWVELTSSHQSADTPPR
jgi:endonuclease/exonuclease/phosphatase family metal-dependent hydrolase